MPLEGAPERVLVLNTLGAPQRRLLGGRKGRSVDGAQPEPVPTSRATVIDPKAMGSDEAERWLAEVRRGGESADAVLSAALTVLNRALHAHRLARADPYARDVTEGSAIVTRIGFGDGQAVADGRYAGAWELPRERKKVKRSMESPDERFAAILGGRERPLVAEELVLHARAALDAHREREAALEARVALEALIAELPAAELDQHRAAVAGAANAALAGDLDEEAQASLAEILGHMQSALRRHRLRG